jgi:hypothetical protein
MGEERWSAGGASGQPSVGLEVVVEVRGSRHDHYLTVVKQKIAVREGRLVLVGMPREQRVEMFECVRPVQQDPQAQDKNRAEWAHEDRLMTKRLQKKARAFFASANPNRLEQEFLRSLCGRAADALLDAAGRPVYPLRERQPPSDVYYAAAALALANFAPSTYAWAAHARTALQRDRLTDLLNRALAAQKAEG